jgi:hypothetical protein
MADGEPVLTASDLAEIQGHCDTAEDLIDGIRAWLRLPIPENLTQTDANDLEIRLVANDFEEDEPVALAGDTDGLPSRCLDLAHAGGVA